MTLSVEDLAIPAVKLIRHARHEDHRGFLEEIFTEVDFRRHDLPHIFRQDNRSFSMHRSTVRGLHLSTDPRGVGKLVTVVRGSIADVAVDLRAQSPTFGQHVIQELSERLPTQVFVPAEFAHGFITLEEDTEVLYKMTERWDPDFDRGIAWNDPDLAIDWPVREEITLSAKDASLPAWSDVAATIRTEQGPR